MSLFKNIFMSLSNPSELISHGIEAYQRNDFEAAITYFENAVELNPDSVDALHNLGQVYFTLEDYEKAILYFSKALNLDPTSQDAYFLRGLSYFHVGMYDNALYDFDALDKHDPSVLNTIGAIYFRRGEYSKALETCQKAYKLDPKSETIRANLQNAQSILKKWEAIKKEKGSSDKFNSLGTTKVLAGAFDDALMCFKKALLIDPSNVGVYNNISEIYSRNKHFYEAIRVLNEALSYDDSNADTYHNLGVEYINLGKLEDAFNNLRKALELNPQHHKALNALGMFYIKQKKYKEAVKYFRKSLEIKYDPRVEHNLNRAVIGK